MSARCPYPEYKDSRVQWLGEVPTSWDVIPLRYLATIETGSKDTVNAEPDGEYPFFVRSQTPLAIDTFSYDCEAILTPGDGDVGNIFHHVTGKFDVHQRVYVLRSFKNVDSRFLYHYFSSEFRKVVDYGGAMTTVASLRRPMFTSFPVVLPPLSEQRAIAVYLDHETAEIDAFIAEQEELIELLRERRVSTIMQAITKGLDPDVQLKDSGVQWLGKVPANWDVMQIKRITQVKRGASPRPIDDPIYFDDDGEWSWVRIADVSASDGYLESTTQKLSELGSSLSVKMEPGSIFVSIAGTVGKPCITRIKACIHDGFVYFPSLPAYIRDYLFRIFESGQCYKGLGKMGTQLNLNTDTIGSIKIPVPSPEEVSGILAYLEHETSEIDAAIADAMEAMELSKERRAALISAAVTGKIDVRNHITAELGAA